MEQIFSLMALAGGVFFICTGLCVNSIEAHESKVFSNILSVLTFLSAVSFVIGFSGLILIHTL